MGGGYVAQYWQPLCGGGHDCITYDFHGIVKLNPYLTHVCFNSALFNQTGEQYSASEYVRAGIDA